MSGLRTVIDGELGEDLELQPAEPDDAEVWLEPRSVRRRPPARSSRGHRANGGDARGQDRPRSTQSTSAVVAVATSTSPSPMRRWRWRNVAVCRCLPGPQATGQGRRVRHGRRLATHRTGDVDARQLLGQRRHLELCVPGHAHGRRRSLDDAHRRDHPPLTDVRPSDERWRRQVRPVRPPGWQRVLERVPAGVCVGHRWPGP